MTDDHDRLVSSLGGVPDRLAAAARSAPAEPPAPGEWAPSDIVRHLIAVEREVWQSRLDQLDTEDGPSWAWLEPDRWTGEPDASLDRLLDEYADARSSTVRRLAALDEAGWARTGTHATFGLLDVAGLLSRAVEHDEEHLLSFARTQ